MASVWSEPQGHQKIEFGEVNYDGWEEYENEVRQPKKKNVPTRIQPLSRKRKLTSVDDLVVRLEEVKLNRLHEEAAGRLKRADEILMNGEVVRVFMKNIPEECVRKLAMACTTWRDFSYAALRERRGNSAFSILWKDDFEEASSFDLCNFIDQPGTLSVGNYALSQSSTLKPVDFALAFANFDIDAECVPNCATLLVTSNSILTTTPDCRRLLHTFSETDLDRRMVSSTLFPGSSHVSFQVFQVPTIMSTVGHAGTCKFIGERGSGTVPKAIILFQYYDLLECDGNNGILDVLKSLKRADPGGQSRIPVIPGIFKNFKCLNKKAERSYNLACGLVINGDEHCKIEVIAKNAQTLNKAQQDSALAQIAGFFQANDFSTKLVLLFYNELLVRSEVSVLSSFVNGFRQKLPHVQLTGIESFAVVVPRFYDLMLRLPSISYDRNNDFQLDPPDTQMLITAVMISYESEEMFN